MKHERAPVALSAQTSHTGPSGPVRIETRQLLDAVWQEPVGSHRSLGAGED